MAEIVRIERGWIYVRGERADDGGVVPTPGRELQLSPVDAWQERHTVGVPMSAIWKSSAQRLAFWRRAKRVR
jgi:hypothetical protein